MEHKGVSFRTGRPLTSPNPSAIRHHCEGCNGIGDISLKNFDILSCNKNLVNMRIMETLFIYKTKPNLNDMSSAFPVKIVNY